ncbi:uncharacterized protein LOC129607042 [Condylostylus longicornis]|uniref:uncharacterized protein LOC129607042 n=1 Tax=Condylostylus longicornis TaxID=2530218 RepID=UPI00244E1099|nr:uncharacterized protein LOC129607042 [Condylostylus longicornis]
MSKKIGIWNIRSHDDNNDDADIDDRKNDDDYGRRSRIDKSKSSDSGSASLLTDNIATASAMEPAISVAVAPSPPSASKQPQQSQLATASSSSQPAEIPSPLPSAMFVSASSEEQINKEDPLPSAPNSSGSMEEYCDPDMISFEIVTGYVFSAPSNILEQIPGTLMLTDCLEACQGNESCYAINYETGLCVLFTSNSDKLPGALSRSQFPVFTIYAQKTCLGIRPCTRAWCVDRVQGHRLNNYLKKTVSANSRQDCFELCLGETDFKCRSANFLKSKHTCELSEMDRITLSGSTAFVQADGYDYLENNCADEPNKLCEFKRLSGRILKTVDSVYQDIGGIDECRDLCLNSPYRCHSYDYGDTGDMVCRLSHHSRATLTDIQDPYLDVPEAATYELSSCYNVSIECRANDMIARIRTSKLFDGKVYAKGSPKSCSADVKNALNFELRMGYQDLECNVRQSGSGRYMNDVVIQHHDMIVTSSDLGLAVTCQYDLTNKTVSNEFDLGVTGDIEPALSEEVIVDSPNVVMKITTRDGSGSEVMRSAEVGDPLALRFEILDHDSPYEIFVRELVAMDGGDNAEITLIDSDGCPTDQFIMGPVYKSPSSGKVLLSHFDAFKFPSSEIVQFRALVTPCMPTCEPVQCDQEDVSGELKSLISFGRKKRSVNATGENAQYNRNHRLRRETTNKPNQDDMLLVQSIQIKDKFGFDKHQQSKSSNGIDNNNETVFMTSDSTGFCVNGIGLVLAGTVFLLAQLVVIAIWTYLYQRRGKQKLYKNESASIQSTYASSGGSIGTGPILVPTQSSLNGSRADSLCKLYDNGYSGRHGRQF